MVQRSNPQPGRDGLQPPLPVVFHGPAKLAAKANQRIITATMDHFQRIYDSEAATYERLVAAEDSTEELARQLHAVAAAATTAV